MESQTSKTQQAEGVAKSYSDLADFSAVYSIEDYKLVVYGQSVHSNPTALLVSLPESATTVEVQLMVSSNAATTAEPRAFVIAMQLSKEVVTAKTDGVWVNGDSRLIDGRIRKQAEPVSGPSVNLG